MCTIIVTQKTEYRKNKRQTVYRYNNMPDAVGQSSNIGQYRGWQKYRFSTDLSDLDFSLSVIKLCIITRGPKGHISCTWVQCDTILRNRSRQTFLFTPRPKKHKLGRGRWDLASCQFSLNSVQRFQRKCRKCFSQSEARAAILFFQSAQKTQTLYRTLRSCFLSSFVGFR